jgi:hypothetical protein
VIKVKEILISGRIGQVRATNMVISSLSCLHDGWLKSMQISVFEGLWQQETMQRYAYTADAKNGMLVELLRQTDLIHIPTQLGATLLDIAGGHMLDTSGKVLLRQVSPGYLIILRLAIGPEVSLE